VAEVDLVIEVILAAEVDLGVGSNLAADEILFLNSYEQKRKIFYLS
jgi:hypothetical protein